MTEDRNLAFDEAYYAYFETGNIEPLLRWKIEDVFHWSPLVGRGVVFAETMFLHLSPVRSLVERHMQQAMVGIYMNWRGKQNG